MHFFKYFVATIILIVILAVSYYVIFPENKPQFLSPLSNLHDTFWPVQSVDTMKFSRDTAREKLNDETYDIEIEQQVSNIAKTGATHIAIATPYDEEFIPFLKRWVDTARKHNLKVWFRGNFSGWEGWFDYKKIDRKEHIKLTEEFIHKHADLFANGDIFVSCPECENGGPGDPRLNGDAEGHKKFLIEEYTVVKKAFQDINKKVIGNYYSMNGDIARLIMDKKTTKSLDGIVAIDHYVSSPEQLNKDIDAYAAQSGGKVVLGEWGAPIPDIHGNMTEEEQADYIDKTFQILLNNKNIEAINYWVNRGGSTELWTNDNLPKKGVASLTKYFKPYIVQGTVSDSLGRNIGNFNIIYKNNIHHFSNGTYSMVLLSGDNFVVEKTGFHPLAIQPDFSKNEMIQDVQLERINKSFIEKLLRR